jgi:hypothetical protein
MPTPEPTPEQPQTYVPAVPPDTMGEVTPVPKPTFPFVPIVGAPSPGRQIPMATPQRTAAPPPADGYVMPVPAAEDPVTPPLSPEPSATSTPTIAGVTPYVPLFNEDDGVTKPITTDSHLTDNARYPSVITEHGDDGAPAAANPLLALAALAFPIVTAVALYRKFGRLTLPQIVLTVVSLLVGLTSCTLTAMLDDFAFGAFVAVNSATPLFLAILAISMLVSVCGIAVSDVGKEDFDTFPG